MQADPTNHTAVSVVVMYTIALTIVLCTLIVLVFKGVDAMPYDAIGIVGAVIFTGVAIGMAQYVKRQAH
jgi:FtsH-binding integral membrane protein